MYVIDTNAIIDFYDRFYCSDVFKELSSDIESIAAQNKLFTIPEVIIELKINLSSASLKEFESLHVPCLNENQRLQEELGGVVEYVESNFSPRLARNFLRGADAYLIAYAIRDQKILVTNERGMHNTDFKLYIPPIAKNFGVEVIDTMKFFRREGLVY